MDGESGERLKGMEDETYLRASGISPEGVQGFTGGLGVAVLYIFVCHQIAIS